MLSYADRTAAWRETKLRHTFEKRDQDGYTDADDYGTVPLQKDFDIKPLITADNGSSYGYTALAENFSRMLDAHEPYVDPMEVLCCRWRVGLTAIRSAGVRTPKWMKPETVEYIKSHTKRGGPFVWDQKAYPYEDLKPYHEKYNLNSGIDDTAHFACDYRIGFELGFGGMLEKIEKYRKVNPDKAEFYDAEEKCVRAIVRWIDRHIEKIEALLAAETRPEIIESLTEMRDNCKAVRLGAPKTFMQVCQWVAFFICASRIYTRDGAGFQLDTLLYPYYEADVKTGILDDEKAKLIIANLLLIDPHYYQVSGVDANDNDITNHLSYLILDAAAMLNISCNITVRVHKNCDKEFFKKAVMYLFKFKNAWPRFCGDRSLAEGYIKNEGVTMEIARERIAVGCNWMAVPGIEFPMNDTIKINVAKVLEVALDEMRTEENKSLERLYELWEKHLTKAVEIIAAGVNLHLDYSHKNTPELIMNLMFKDSIETGEDASVCAQLHTMACDGAGLAIVADSLGAIETRLVNEKLITWDGLYEALDNNFENERVRMMMNSSPKYCQGGTVSDAWAKRLTESYTRILRAQKMPKGRCLVPGWFSWSNTITFGRNLGATPNGRRKGEPINHGANPVSGFRRDGAVTAQSNGIASVQCGYGNTAPLQLEFDPKITADEGGLEAVCTLIREHFERGGTLININILDGEKLMAAHENPDLFPDLVVRVTGFTAYFVSLSPEFRQLVVDRFLEGI